MNQQEYNQLTSEKNEPSVLGLANLMDRTPRTLIFGYTTDRDTFHVYIGSDSLIHVLLYSESGSRTEGQPRFFTQSHTFGESGGLTSNNHYVPSKRVYPESCDYEFCKALKSHGVHIPFTIFSEGADAPRKEARNGYAGLTHNDGGIPVVSLHALLADDPAFPKPVKSAYALTTRLVSQAARDVRASAVTSMCGEYISIPEPDAEKVLEKAREFLHRLSETTVLDDDLADSLVSKVFGHGGYLSVFEERVSGGEFSIELDVKNADFLPGRGLTNYEGKPDGFWIKGLVGSYKGRPFFACKNKNGHADIRLSQFGETERFVELYLRLYSMEPAKAPVKAGKTEKA